MLGPIRALRRDDSGISLVELLVYMFLSVVVLTIISTILINSLRAEATVRTAAQSADTAQLAAQSLSRGIHNASAIEVSAPAAGIQLLRTRSLDSSAAGVWRCEAWAVIDGELRTTNSPDAIAPPTTAGAVADWTLIAEGAAGIAAAPVFTLSADLRTVDIGLTVANGDGLPITISTAIVSRQPVPATGIESMPCF